MKHLAYLFLTSIFLIACTNETPYQIDGELKQWHKVTLTFNGPDLSETSEENPFLNYRLEVTFSKGDKKYIVPGYFAADGQAGTTSASSGNNWRVHFNPDEVGKWNFEVSFRKGKSIAIQQGSDLGESIAFDGLTGSIEVTPSDKTGRDFRANGRIALSENGRFLKHMGSQKYFLKGGADSPENFLAYQEFDGTYRHSKDHNVKGESDPTENLHRFEPHLKDWNEGDPTWQNGKGKGIIGALNYLANQNMNSVYFLVMNINGDGKDVWPYVDHETRDRFDCSKLDQWEVVFEHMEKLGLMMHVVTQETENEKLLDEGNTGPERKLFYRELIARFGHHNALIWNLGEENGPADFSPDGQNSEQQKAMATNLKAQDPYKHPVIIHTHSTKAQKDELLPALLNHQPLDGLSFQINKRSHVHEEVLKWTKIAEESGHSWMIQMDEIGAWHTGVMPDEVNPDHDTIRQKVLWGSLMAGAAGVEWYFGAHYPHNDLACEDWRSRENMWEQTSHALDFFNNHLSYWKMQNMDNLIHVENAYCLAQPGEKYAIYFPMKVNRKRIINLRNQDKNYKVEWYNPRLGGALETGSKKTVEGGGMKDIGDTPRDSEKDWVALLTAIDKS